MKAGKRMRKGGQEKLRRAFFRWDHLLVVFVLGLPFVLLILMGFLWLWEHDAVLWFLAISLVVSTAVVILRNILRKHWYKVVETGNDAFAPPEDVTVEPDPDWLETEKAVFADASQQIAVLTRTPLPWEELPWQALEIVNNIAAGLNGKNKGALNFTLPEALLLLESTASRYREHLRSRLPFSDQVTLATLYWFWRQRNRANVIWQVAQSSSRLARFALNPAAGVLRELEQLVSGSSSADMTDSMIGVMQAVLLEEVAYGAIELYSGRLRFSDEELMQIELARSKADDERKALPDAPVRILFVGQTSAGKSTLINALLATERAETDAAATTHDLVTYETQFAGIPCNFLDSEGLDGTTKSLDRMLEEMTQSDMIVWVMRANRPARDIDVRLKDRFDAWFASHPRRRKPAVVVIATALDQLIDIRDHLSVSAQSTISAVRKSIKESLKVPQVFPFSAGATVWNLGVVAEALSDGMTEAQRVQRNRRRVEGASQERGMRSQIRKGGRGVKLGLKMAAIRVARAVTSAPHNEKKQE